MRHCLSVAFLLLAGCASSLLPEHRAEAGCAATRFPENQRIGPATVDKFAGTYRNGKEVLYVTREGEHRFVVQRPGFGTRELATDNIEGWRFRDGCGLIYDFMLPPDGPGGWLKITGPVGAVSNWNRS